MIVNPFGDGQLLLVLQTDHSRIAGQLAARWGNGSIAPVKPYLSMVLATQEHDNGWGVWEMMPTLNAANRPLDYIGSASYLGKDWMDLYRVAITQVTAQDPYAGYMVSLHGDGLLTSGMGLLPRLPDQSHEPPARDFLAEQKAFRATLLPELRTDDRFAADATDDQLWTNYKLMEVFDQLGQFVTNRYPFNSTARKNGPTRTLSDVPVPTGHGDDVRLDVEVLDETNAIVRPYPFAVNPFVVTYPARVVPDRAYADRADFLHHFYQAEQRTITYFLHAESSGQRG